MISPLVSDALWSIIASLLPVSAPRPWSGRPRVSDRAALTGLLVVLRIGIQWEMLPLEMGCGSGITCWRRLRDWQEAGVWTHCTASCCAGFGRPTGSTGAGPAWTAYRWLPEGGPQDRADPTDRGRLGTKRHLVTDWTGIPLAFILTAANTYDSVSPIGGKGGRIRHRPDKLHADKAYDHGRCRQACRRRGIAPRIARVRLDQPQPPAGHPLPAQRRQPPRRHRVRLLAHLLQQAAEQILKGALGQVSDKKDRER